MKQNTLKSTEATTGQDFTSRHREICEKLGWKVRDVCGILVELRIQTRFGPELPINKERIFLVHHRNFVKEIVDGTLAFNPKKDVRQTLAPFEKSAFSQEEIYLMEKDSEATSRMLQILSSSLTEL